ncbi:MAG: isoaspartyl peptidase/L-asparaginase family protein [Pirellulales bacterium]
MDYRAHRLLPRHLPSPRRAAWLWCLLVASALHAKDPTALVNVHQAPSAKPLAKITFALALHGGAGATAARLDDSNRAPYEQTLTEALSRGRAILEQGGSSVDAVECVLRFLEDDPKFNAGRGAVLAYDGTIRLDAAIMDGRTRACGAVAAVETVKNPISLARHVMTQSPHVLLVGHGADRFAQEVGCEQVASDYFRTDRRVAAWQAKRRKIQHKNETVEPDRDTVGCVALDQHGSLAAGTSTGGLAMKRFGRVGDSPIIGAGTYADNRTCAVSCSGIGEEFIRNVVAYDVSAQMAYRGLDLQQAVDLEIHQRLKPDTGGMIAIDRHGAIAMELNTKGMFRAAADSTGRFEVAAGR